MVGARMPKSWSIPAVNNAFLLREATWFRRVAFSLGRTSFLLAPTLHFFPVRIRNHPQTRAVGYWQPEVDVEFPESGHK